MQTLVSSALSVNGLASSSCLKTTWLQMREEVWLWESGRLLRIPEMKKYYEALLNIRRSVFCRGKKDVVSFVFRRVLS
jgi:hypothetical protein